MYWASMDILLVSSNAAKVLPAAGILPYYISVVMKIWRDGITFWALSNESSIRFVQMSVSLTWWCQSTEEATHTFYRSKRPDIWNFVGGIYLPASVTTSRSSLTMYRIGKPFGGSVRSWIRDLTTSITSMRTGLLWWEYHTQGIACEPVRNLQLSGNCISSAKAASDINTYTTCWSRGQ